MKPLNTLDTLYLNTFQTNSVCFNEQIQIIGPQGYFLFEKSLCHEWSLVTQLYDSQLEEISPSYVVVSTVLTVHWHGHTCWDLNFAIQVVIWQVCYSSHPSILPAEADPKYSGPRRRPVQDKYYQTVHVHHVTPILKVHCTCDWNNDHKLSFNRLVAMYVQRLLKICYLQMVMWRCTMHLTLCVLYYITFHNVHMQALSCFSS